MNWIRIAVGIGDDPDIYLLAERLSVSPHEAIGLVVLLLVRFPEHAETGDLSAIPDALLERWSGWSGERGAFAKAVRTIFLNDAGIWEAWEKHNGAAMREHKATRERAAEYRRRRATDLLASANGTPESTGNGTAYGTPNGPALRTNVRTNITTGGRKRPEPQNGHYAPGHEPAQPIAPPFCAECGDGVAVQPEGSKRFVQVHAPQCSQRTV